jgi:hypothetical protein
VLPTEKCRNVAMFDLTDFFDGKKSNLVLAGVGDDLR